MNEIYEPKFIQKLFNTMSRSYARVNYITSFGFSNRWRRQCVNQVKIEKGKIIVDLMTGMGECWKYILKNSNHNSSLIALDFSSEMIKKAQKNKSRFNAHNITLLQEDVFNNSIQDETADYVISGFGLKTCNDAQLEQLAYQINRILKPGGKFSLIDVSIPRYKILRSFYMFYLKKIIPLLGKILLGNPENYKMLGVYSQKFNNATNAYEIFKTQNFEMEYKEYFYGCATGITGQKK